MKRNSIKNKITLNFNLSLSVIIVFLVLSISSLIVIYSQYKSHKEILFPILNLSKDLEYLSHRHWDQFSYLKSNSNNIGNKTNDLNNIEKEIDSLFNAFYDLYFNEKKTIITITKFSNLINQLIKIDTHFREYNFLVNKNINVIKINNLNFSKDENIELKNTQKKLSSEIKNLNTQIVLFTETQHKLFKYFVITLILIFILISSIFTVMYSLLWRKTSKNINLSFEQAITFLKMSLEKKSVDYVNLKNVELEIKQFIDILNQSITKLHISEENLKKTNKKLDSIRQDERKQIAQHLHDNLGQNINALKLENKVLTRQLSNVNDQSKNTLNRVEHILNDSNHLLRQITNNLRIPNLKKHGLIKLTRKLIHDRNELGLTKFTLTTTNTDELNYNDKTLVMYQCIQEGINNILKHAKATAADISIIVHNTSIEIKIKDNGIGITSNHLNTMGLKGMQEAVENISGLFNITSFKNEGTNINIKIPS